MEQENTPLEERTSPWTASIQSEIARSGLLQMDRLAPLVAIQSPDPEELLAQLNQGAAMPLLALGDEATGQAAPAAVTRWEAAPLEEALSQLAREAGCLDWLQGCHGLCLAEGRLVHPSGISAPLLLWPVDLAQEEGRWQLTRWSEGVTLNRAALALLPPECPPPAEGWSQNREPLARQLDQALSGQCDWRREEGLWLGAFPLWLLELEELISRPAPENTLAAALSNGDALPEAAPPDCSDPRGEEGILTPLPLDGVQMTALRRLNNGGHLLLAGGPGTGKTQLLAGLMANAIGGGQHILLTARRESDRKAALDRMQEMGLDPLCLHIPSQGDRKLAVLHQFNIAAQLRPQTSTEGFFSLSQQTAQLSRRLDRYVSTLHTPSRCGLSPFQLICRYLEEDGTEGYLPLSGPTISHLDQDGLENRLSCARDLTQAAQTVGQPWDHPLTLVYGSEYDPAQAAQLPQVAGDLTAAIQELTQSGENWCRRTGLEPPVTQEDWRRLQEGARLLLEWQNYPAGWADSVRIPLLTETVQELRGHFDLAQRLLERIREKWEDGVLAMDAVRLEKQWRFLKEEWTLPTEADRESQLRKLLAQAETLLTNLEQAGRRWAKSISAAVPTTRDSWERNYEVAVELARWKEIPSEWGSCAGLQALLWDVGELIDHGKQAKESKEVLLREWSEAFLSLDGKALSERWQKEGGNWGLGWLKPQSRLRTELEPYCQCKLTTDVLENGLRWLADYQEELAQCDEIYHRWERELGSVYKREETVWLWLEAARVVAAESHDWLTELTGSNDFLRQYGSSEEAVAAAGQLQANWEQARDILGRLDVMIGRTSQPDSRDWLSARRSDCRRLRNLLKIRKQLEEQAKSPVVLGEISDTLSLLAQHQKERAAVAALSDRWHKELDGLFVGADTDWDGLYTLSIKAVKSDDALAELTGDLELRARLAGEAEAQACAQILRDAYAAVEEGSRLFAQLACAHLTTTGGPWLKELEANSRLIIDHLDQLEPWMNWQYQCRRGERLGLPSFVAHYDRPVDPEEDTPSLFRKSIYRALLLLELDWQPELKQFSARQFGEVLRQYAKLDRQFTRRTREELLHVGSARIPDLFRDENLQEELNLLRWANQTQARDISLDGLLRGLPQLTRRLFPCVLAAPADALRCFGGGREEPPFDYIAVDGADQVSAPIGLSLLALGKTALLTGGGRALPEGLFAQEGSLFARCREAGLPQLTLDRCYLIQQESLLWLDQQLTGVKGYPTCHPRDFRLRYQTVVGRLSDGTNPAEGAAVAARVLSLVEQGRDSLAVVTATEPQARLIRALLRQTGAENPALAPRLEDIPVLPTEELGEVRRDIVLFSLTLGTDMAEGLEQAQSLLSGWDGVFPLVDALAAARQELWLFSSLDEADWPALARLRPQLVSFLEYVQDGTVHHTVRPLPCQDPVQQGIRDALEQAGYVAEPGMAPISIQAALPERPQDYVLGIMLDGPGYAAIPRTRERELSQTQLLQDRGWNLCRVWTLDWWQDRDRVIALLLKMLKLLQDPEKTMPEKQASPAAPKEPPLYTPARLTVMGIRDNEVSNPSFQNRIYRVVEQILEQEAPISVSQLTDRMLVAFTLDAQDQELRQHCASLWRKLGLRITREEGESYVWQLDQDPDRYSDFRRCGEGEHYRRPEDVSCQEGANAACAVLARETALTPAELVQQTARALGYRSGPAALDCARRGVDCALFMGRAVETAVGSIVLNTTGK